MEAISKNYDPRRFAEALKQKFGDKGIPPCPFCGGRKYSTTQNFATIPISREFSTFSLGPQIPTGMLVCENCGHVEFFALGPLGLLPIAKREGGQDEQK